MKCKLYHTVNCSINFVVWPWLHRADWPEQSEWEAVRLLASSIRSLIGCHAGGFDCTAFLFVSWEQLDGHFIETNSLKQAISFNWPSLKVLAAERSSLEIRSWAQPIANYLPERQLKTQTQTQAQIQWYTNPQKRQIRSRGPTNCQLCARKTIEKLELKKVCLKISNWGKKHWQNLISVLAVKVKVRIFGGHCRYNIQR